MLDMEKEIRQLEKKLSTDSAPPEVYLRLAELYDAIGKPHRAHAVLKRQVERNIAPALAYFGMGMLYEKYGDEQAALENYQNATEQDPALRQARSAIRRINRMRFRRKMAIRITGFARWTLEHSGFLTMFVLTPLMILLVSLLAVDTANNNSFPGFHLILQRIAILAVSFIAFFAILKFYK